MNWRSEPQRIEETHDTSTEAPDEMNLRVTKAQDLKMAHNLKQVPKR